MPANLPPEYFAAEKAFKQSGTPSEKIAALRDLIATVPKHKGTDKLRADLRERLSKLKEESVRKKKGGKGDLYTVDREGASQIALVGFPNSGKSSLLKSLTNASPVIADYPMSTVMPLSGMMPFEDIQFQLVDLPPVGNESTDGWVSGILRNSDVFLLAIDLSEEPDIQTELLIEQLAAWNIYIMKKDGTAAEKAYLLTDYKKGIKKAVIVANKKDIAGAGEGLKRLLKRYGNSYPVIAVSSTEKEGLDELIKTVFDISGIIRVYTKEPGKAPDMSKPFTIPLKTTVLGLSEMIHKDFIRNLKYACVWGSSRFPGQRVQKDYILHDRDIVEFHL
ncbi:MAG: 50S ribosome-binding GTPase [Candidatus Mariimomonas ferrooxydans]